MAPWPRPPRRASTRDPGCSRPPERSASPRAPSSSTAPSARYDLRDRVVRFGGPIEGTGSGQESGGLSKLTAREGLFRRDESVLELEFADAQSRDGDRFAADHVVLKLASSGGHHPEWVRSTGNVRGILAADSAASTAAGVAPGPAKQRQYSGDESLASFGPDGKPRGTDAHRSAGRAVGDGAKADGRADRNRIRGRQGLVGQGDRRGPDGIGDRPGRGRPGKPRHREGWPGPRRHSGRQRPCR